MTQIRFATVGAAEGWAEVAAATAPYLVTSEERVLHEMEHTPGLLARYVAVEDRRVIGIAGLRDYGDEAGLMVMVHPDNRGRGIGGLLLQRLLRVAPSVPLRTIVNDDERSTAVARHWDFELERQHAVSSVDPRILPPAGPAPSGRHVVPLVEAGVDAVWACRQATVGDEPSGLTRQMPLEEYAATQWRNPTHRPDLGRAVIEGDTVLSYSSVYVAGTRAWSSMTGTRPVCRGQGLAILAKHHTLNALAAAGVTAAWTGNDDANAPMLAVNQRLGYRRSATSWGAVRTAAVDVA
jgi:GNAT superfamily N-acetyltransferase